MAGVRLYISRGVNGYVELFEVRVILTAFKQWDSSPDFQRFKKFKFSKDFELKFIVHDLAARLFLLSKLGATSSSTNDIHQYLSLTVDKLPTYISLPP